VILLALPAPSQARLSDEQIDQVIAFARTADGPAIAPRTSRVVPLSWSNRQGSTIAGHGLRATFAFADVAGAPGALEVVVSAAGGPRTCTIDATVRASIH
jgi:hypothetical protein